MKSRKLIFSIVGLIVLCLAFILMTIKNAMTDGIFIAWMGGILGIIGIYTGGNVMSKKYKSNEKT